MPEGPVRECAGTAAPTLWRDTDNEWIPLRGPEQGRGWGEELATHQGRGGRHSLLEQSAGL